MKMKLSRGATINMGNYQSYRFDVGIEADFHGISVADAWNAITKDVDDLFKKEIEESKKQRP